MDGVGAFGRLWIGQTLSVFGTSVSALAIPTIAIIGLQTPTFWVGVLEAAQFAAFPILGLFAGVWIDRWSRRRTMLIADAIRMCALASIPLAALAHELGYAHLVAVALVMGICTVFFDIAYQALVPSLVDASWLEHANARLEASSSVAMIAGSGVAGALIAVVGAPLAVAVDAASYLASVLGLAGIRVSESHRGHAVRKPSSFATALRQGLVLVFRSPILRGLVGATACVNLGWSIAGSVYLLFFYRTLHLSPALVGLLLAVGDVGFAGALLAPWAGRRVAAGALLFWTVTGVVVATAAIPLAQVLPAVPVIVVIQAIIALCIPLYNITQVSLRQRLVPADLLGRTSATMKSVVWGVMPVGAVLGGALGAWIGVAPTICVGAAVMCGAFAFVLHPSLRRLPLSRFVEAL